MAEQIARWLAERADIQVSLFVGFRLSFLSLKSLFFSLSLSLSVLMAIFFQVDLG